MVKFSFNVITTSNVSFPEENIQAVVSLFYVRNKFGRNRAGTDPREKSTGNSNSFVI